MLLHRKIIHFVLCAAALLILVGCSKSGQQRQVDDMMLEVITAPAPLQVGESATITAILSRAGEPVNDCSVRFRQHMPGMEMSSDNTFFAMKPQGPEGAYTAQSHEFSMGGDWELEFAVECGQQTHKVVFPYHLEWPE